MIHILTVHFIDRWVDIQLKFLDKYLDTPYRVYTILGKNYEKHKDKFYKASSGQDKHYYSLQKLHGMLKEENPAKDDIVIVLDSDAFPIKPITKYLFSKLKEHEFLGINEPKHNYEPTPIQPHVCFYAFKYEFFDKYGFEFKYEGPGVNRNWVDWMIDWFKEKEIVWYPLNRTNEVNLHILYFGVYDDMIYHHWAGSRFDVCRQDRLRTDKSREKIIEENTQIESRVFTQITQQSDEFMNFLMNEYVGELE